MAIDATNSYITLADANAYFEGRLHTEAWTNATDADKEKALRQATRTIDRQRIIGRKATLDQALAFPRAYPGSNAQTTVFPDTGWTATSGWVVETAVSQEVKDATCEQALFLLEQTAWDRERERLKAAGVTSKNVGGASESFSGNPNFLAPLARELLRKYLVTVGRLV